MIRRALLGATLLAACQPRAPGGSAAEVGRAAPVVEQVLFDGASLDAWQVTPFGGEGAVRLDGDRLILEVGAPLTGVTWAGGDLPTVDYELSLEAARISGSDFFCGLTFPVGDAHASLILGGWGGSLCGISSLDGADAARNETCRHVYLETGHTFDVRVQVTAERIRAWIDGEPLVDVGIAGRRISVRPEVDLSRPLGIASFATTAAIGNVRLRRL